MPSQHYLDEISSNEWKTLLELYAERKDEPNGYIVIKSLIDCLEKEPHCDIKCFALNGDWKNDGTYLMIINYGKFRDIFFNTLSDNLERLTHALCCLAPDPCNELFGYGERLVPAAEYYINKFEKDQREIMKTYWYKANNEIVANFSTEPPAGITLRNMNINDASTINDLWPHRFEGSEEFIRLAIACYVSVGAYDADGKLVAWCLRPFGAIGLLQVLESHKRLGLGSLLVRYLSKKIYEQGEAVLAPVLPENMPSRKMFEKLGFKIIDTVYWNYKIN